MIIHVVQQGDTIDSIADRYGVSADRLILDNGLFNSDNLVIGQTIVVVYPDKTYIVKEGDSIDSIAKSQGVTVKQILRNNPYLSEREYLYPGETLVISYQYSRTITTSGYALPYINRDVLIKTLPYLTYLSIYNYKASREGEVTIFYDETELIQLAKQYGAAPLMLITTLTEQGQEDIEAAYEILLNNESQERHIQNILNVLQVKEYYGVNVSLKYLNKSNLNLYENFLKRLSYRLEQAGFHVFYTIDPKIESFDNNITFEELDYTNLSQTAEIISFLNYAWGASYEPPSPVSSINNVEVFIKYAVGMIPPNKILAGLALIGYDWELPYVAGFTNANSLTLNSALELAIDVRAEIKFDEVSKTPYFEYYINKYGNQVKHMVWFIDARTIEGLKNIIDQYQLRGTGIWNIMEYNAQLWLIINSQYQIEDIYPEV